MAESRVFDKIRIGLASPEEVRVWSYGEVKKPETINYRTFKPERDGLFCERIFGPTKDWECHCGRYKKVKFKGIVCDRCGVEVTRSKVRRERMGHIELAAPVSHIWYLKGVPSPMALLLDMSPRPLEKVIYFGSYIVTRVDKKRVLDEWELLEKTIADELEDRKNAPPPSAIASVMMAVEPTEEEETLVGRIVTEEVLDPGTGEAILEAGDVVTQEDLDTLSEAGIVELAVEGDEAPTPEMPAAPRTLDEIAGDDLEAGLKLLQTVERKELLVEDQFRQLERVKEVLMRRIDRSYSTIVDAGLGAAAVRDLLKEIDLEALRRELETEIAQTQGPRRLRSVKRLEIVRAFLESKSRPEWMILDVVPVIPPELRPMVQLDGGRFATSDLNDLYRRIINRNNRLKKIQEIKAPESIINHEKRLLQEAVDALIDNGRRTRPVVGSNNRPLRSLSDMLKGKEGRFRKNLLGKRVDYSGRSVIVVGPNLKLHQCGLPKEMALELFKPFVMKALVDRGVTTNIKTAKRLIDRVRPEVWDALEDVIKDHPVLLNRAPTLHRLGIQAFEPILVDGKAIRVHPLVCAAFGADFDGDQMAVHVPLSSMAQAEGQCLMLATRNLFRPADGSPIVAPIQDIVLGMYYQTQRTEGLPGSGLIFRSVDEALLAHAEEKIHLHAPVKIRDYDPDHLVALYKEQNPDASRKELDLLDPYADGMDDYRKRCRKALFEVTIGRLLMSLRSPWMMRYTSEYNKAKNRKGITETEMDKKAIAAYVRDTYEDYGAQKTIELLDDCKDLGFQFATQSGMSISLTDMDEPAEREKIIKEAEDHVKDINRRYRRGAITAGERQGQVLEAWTGASARIADAILAAIGRDNPLFMITNSGARGSKTQITQLSGMRGLMSDPFGGLIEELPIKSNFHRGLNILEYFVSTHGQRKGLADTALRTADAGYLTRRLVDVAQDVIVREIDCQTTRGIYVKEIREAGEPIEMLHERIRGRVLLDEVEFSEPDVVDPETGEVKSEGHTTVIPANTELTDLQARQIEKAGIKSVGLRSPLTCEARMGICVKCYGRDMATQKTVEVGTAVGIIAAQSIGEPGTQLTMRTFHTGGVAGKTIVGVASVKQKKQEALRELHADIESGHVTLEDSGAAGSDRERSRAVQAMLKVLEEQVGGLLRVVELVEGRKPKGQAIITDVDGTVEDIEQKGSRRVVIHSKQRLDGTESLNNKVLGESVVDHSGTEDVEVIAGRTLAKAVRDKSGKNLVSAGDILTEANLQAIVDERLAAELQLERVLLLSPLVGRQPIEDLVHPESGEVIAKAGATLDVRAIRRLQEAGIRDSKFTPNKSKAVNVHALQDLTGHKSAVAIQDPASGEVLVKAGKAFTEKDAQRIWDAGISRVAVSGDPETVKVEHGLPLAGRMLAENLVDETTGKVLLKGNHTLTNEDVDKLVQGGVARVKVRPVIVWAGDEISEKLLRQIRDKGIEEITLRFSHLVPYRGALEVKSGDEVRAGDRLTEGPLDPDRVLELQGINGVQDYMVKEIQSVYKSQGVDINDKHIEVIVRQMLKKRKILDPGDTLFLPGQMVDKFEFEDANAAVREKGGTEATAEWLLLGITEASLATDSFLSAASFQKTTKVLADAAVKGKKDNLVGLKENVIIGRLIPAGTGMEVYHKMGVGGEGGRPVLRRSDSSQRDEVLVEALRALGASDDETTSPASLGFMPSVEDVIDGLPEPEEAAGTEYE